MRKILFFAWCIFPFISFSQEKEADSIETKKPQKDTLIVESESAKKVVVPDFASAVPSPDFSKDSAIFYLKDVAEMQAIDSIWKAKLLASDLYPKMKKSLVEAPNFSEIITDLPTDTLKARLEKLNAKTPFRIEYNPSLESVISYYLKRDREAMENLMAISQYYFPLFEKELDNYNIPLEMKYLAIVESALNPKAKSRVGATGLWQFMFSTGKMMGLDVSSYVDERMDPVLATEAACKYLSSLYGTFEDWDLALASYNSGPGNVSKAIRRSGGNKNYWELRNYLPRETAGYVPAFIATMYIFEYAEEHGFQPYKPEITYFETDTIRVKQLLKFDHIAETTGVDEELLAFLNPSYKLGIIPFIKDEEYYVRLPIKSAGVFVANEEIIYNYVSEETEKDKLPEYVEADAKIRYRVKSGDFLGRIAEAHGVGVSKIKQWNNLRSNNLRVGQYLTIYPRKPVESRVTSTSTQNESSSEKIYTVKRGDSLWSISRKFPGVTVKNIQNWNDIGSNKLKPGMKLKISSNG